MKIALLNVADETWMGGVYYVVNLARALLRCANNDGERLLIVGSEAMLQKHYQEFRGHVDFLVFPSSRAKSLLWKFAYSVTHLPAVLSSKLSGDHKVSIQYRDHLTPRLGRMLPARDVAVVFPGSYSLGSDFDVPWIGWIFDFQHHYYRQFFSDEECRSRDETFARIGRESRLVVVSSQQAMKDFQRFLPDFSHKARVLKFRSVLPQGWDGLDPALTARELGLPDRFLMIPNQFFVHKNHRTAFEAVLILRDRGFDIHVVCTGAVFDFRGSQHVEDLRSYMKTNLLESRIHVLGLLPRLRQIALMRMAMAVIQPSLFEGWSTVVEDCRTLGKKVFLSDIPVHREQNPPHASYFDPLDSEMLAMQIADRWEELETGPCIRDEIEAMQTQQTLIGNYATDFLSISAEASGSVRSL